jgi:monoamine oxidase
MKSPSDWTRRDLLKRAALALPALAAFPRLSSAEEAAPATPETPATSGRGPLQVIVVGAGLAGLAAAYELVALGAAVTVLEAQTRPGGRIHTLREPFAEGLYAEAGAIDFADGNRHTVRYVKTFNLPTETLAATPALSPVYHLRGKRLEPAKRAAAGAATAATGAKAPDWPFALTPEEKAAGINGMFAKYFAPVEKLGDPADPAWRLQPFKSFDSMTLADFLKHQGASNEAIELLGDSLWFGYGWSTVSALHRLISDVALFCEGQASKMIPGGNDRLPQAFAKALGDRIRYSAPVTKVLQEPGQARVVFRQGQGEQSLTADRVILTAPCPALRKVTFVPELPEKKRQIWDQLEYNPVTRIYLQVKRRFWVDAGDAGNAFTDLPIQLVNEQPVVRPAGQGPRAILECHVKGPEAARLAALDPKALLALAVENLEKVHPGFKEQYETGTSYSWGSDPWAGGGYAWWKPGQLTDWGPELARPEGRLHFAGEHTSALARTIEGALESGNRAAREVHAAPRPLSPLEG